MINDLEGLAARLASLEAKVARQQLGSLSQSYNSAQAGSYATLLSASASIKINLAKGNNYKHTLTEDTTLAEPSNPLPGQAGVIEFTQGSGPYTLGFNLFWRWVGGTCPTISTGDGDISLMSYIVSSDASFATCVWLDDMQPCVPLG